MAVAADAALLHLAQWLSPSFPVGGFAFSQGLDWAIAAGEVGCAADLGRWLADLLEHGSGRTDAILLCLALRGAMPLEDLADLAAALAPARQRRTETEAQGTAFAAALVALGAEVPPLPYPLAVGVAARRLELPPAQVAALWLQTYAGNLVQIAVRLVPLGQAEGQAVLAGLHPLILHVAAEAAEAGHEALGSASFFADLAAMHHETMEVRLCRT
jgi:urease accessory protein